MPCHLTATTPNAAVLAVTLVLACGPCAGATGANPMQTTSPDLRRDMITALPAAGPHPSLGDQARVFDRFVGTWDNMHSRGSICPDGVD